MRIVMTVIMLMAALSAYAENISLPEGFTIDVYAERLHGARSMALGNDGTIYVGTRTTGNVYAVRDTDGDGISDRRWIIAKGLNSPNGVAFRDGALFVAEISRVIRFDNIGADLQNPPEPETVFDKLPDDTHHGWKYIAFGPDGRLYIPVGAPCNICDEGLPYAALHSIKPDGSDFRNEAKGIRNTVGFDWNPVTGKLWFTDNGRDWLGDDLPPEELNRIDSRNQHFGYPYCHAGEIPDPEFGSEADCADFVKPQVTFQAHTAPLGMKFYNGDMFPEKYRGGMFIAQHGSWNRSTKVGYRVMFVTVDGDKEVFAEGWLKDGDVTGRPVDILVLNDGSMLISDDRQGRIYRVVYGK